MRVKISFATNDLLTEGFAVDEDFQNLDYVPRIGEWVVLPQTLCELIHEKSRAKLPLPAIRFRVVMVEHRWDKLVAPVLVVTLRHLNDE